MADEDEDYYAYKDGGDAGAVADYVQGKLRGWLGVKKRVRLPPGEMARREERRYAEANPPFLGTQVPPPPPPDQPSSLQVGETNAVVNEPDQAPEPNIGQELAQRYQQGMAASGANPASPGYKHFGETYLGLESRLMERERRPPVPPPPMDPVVREGHELGNKIKQQNIKKEDTLSKTREEVIRGRIDHDKARAEEDRAHVKRLQQEYDQHAKTDPDRASKVKVDLDEARVDLRAKLAKIDDWESELAGDARAAGRQQTIDRPAHEASNQAASDVFQTEAQARADAHEQWMAKRDTVPPEEQSGLFDQLMKQNMSRLGAKVRGARAGAAPPVKASARQLSPHDAAALKWVRANPKDPDADGVRAGLRKSGVTDQEMTGGR